MTIKTFTTIRKKFTLGNPNSLHSRKSPQSRNKGFTIAELLIATIVLGILVVTSASIYTNFYNSIRNLRAANLVYEEARFTMERIVREVRGGTLDYEEYYNQAANFFGLGINETYGQNYCQYSRQFYDAGPDGNFGTFDDESTGVRKASSPAPIESQIQNNLYLIDGNGTRRTYIQRFQDPVTRLGKVALLKLVGRDYGVDHVSSETSNCPRDQGEKDGLIDTWECEPGFDCIEENVLITLPPPDFQCTGTIQTIRYNPEDLADSSYVDITPSSIDIVDLRFIITPKDDPRKAYADPSVQIQPHVTIRMIARANPKLTSTFRGESPSIILESTVSSRTQREIITECNLQECIDGDVRPCPKTGDVVNGATATCTQGIWPTCSDAIYEARAFDNLGLDTNPPFGATGRTFYESSSEFGSCGAPLSDSDILLCKQRRCSDGYDNDGNGKTDVADPTCLFQICNNGFLDPGEECIDVGGICFFRQKVSVEAGIEYCFDGYDNDCNYDPVGGTGGADEFDKNCINYMCSNGLLDPTIGNPFVRSDYEPKNYLLGAELSDYTNDLDESCIDIGGLCDNATISGEDHLEQSETGALCYDNLDNDCNYDEFASPTQGADEFDTKCQPEICGNNQLDCELAPSNYDPKDYLADYSDDLCGFIVTDNDEQCNDVGGLCGPTISENTDVYCFDGIDNDCTNGFDGDQGAGSDPNCCPDGDNDGFSLISLTCIPENALVGGAPGEIDCNDLEPLIRPGEIEICDNERYPSDYIVTTLRNRPIDNNCSAANQLYGASGDSGLDEDDPDCCIDTDGDGFGVVDAYLYQKSGNCEGSAVGLQERPPYDCRDTDPNINPGIQENTIALCTDGINNNCRISDATSSERKDHIDMYGVAPGLADAYSFELFDPECCDFTAMELCDDTASLLGNGSGSDDNCNGLEGFNDKFCLSVNGLVFHDNFTSATFINASSTASHNAFSGTITLSPATGPPQQALSNSAPLDPAVCTSNVLSVSITPDAILPPGTNIIFEVSNNDGTVFFPVPPFSIPGSSVNVPIGTVGTNLRWRATLIGNGTAGPTLNSMRLSYTCF